MRQCQSDIASNDSTYRQEFIITRNLLCCKGGEASSVPLSSRVGFVRAPRRSDIWVAIGGCWERTVLRSSNLFEVEKGNFYHVLGSYDVIAHIQIRSLIISERLPRFLNPTHLILLGASSYSKYLIIIPELQAYPGIPECKHMVKIRCLAPVVLRPIGGFGHHQLNPQLTGRSLAACKHHRMWFPHPEKMGIY